MNIDEALYAHLTTYQPLVDLDVRIEPQQVNLKKSLPAIGYGRAGIRPTQHRSSTKANHGRTRFQFDLYGTTHQEVNTVTAVFKDAMAEFQRSSEPRVDVSLIQDDRDAYEAEPEKWRRIVDYHIWHTE